jgi:molybdopterin-binding protein
MCGASSDQGEKIRGPGQNKPGGDQVKLSARNQLQGTVTDINRGEAIANVALDVAGQRLVASITVEAVQELGIGPGSEVTVIVKASDVMLAVDD